MEARLLLKHKQLHRTLNNKKKHTWVGRKRAEGTIQARLSCPSSSLSQICWLWFLTKLWIGPIGRICCTKGRHLDWDYLRARAPCFSSAGCHEKLVLPNPEMSRKGDEELGEGLPPNPETRGLEPKWTLQEQMQRSVSERHLTDELEFLQRLKDLNLNNFSFCC